MYPCSKVALGCHMGAALHTRGFWCNHLPEGTCGCVHLSERALGQAQRILMLDVSQHAVLLKWMREPAYSVTHG